MLAICAALGWEIRPVLRAVGPVKRSKHGGLAVWESTGRARSIVIYRTGIGYEAAAEATRRVLGGALPIRAVVNTGCAGALAADLTAGSVVIPGFLLDPSNQRHEADESYVSRLRAAALRANIVNTGGPILTSPVALGTASEKRAAHQRFGTTAVDMEGSVVASVARQHGIRFGSARAILDTSALDLPTGSTLKMALRGLTAQQPFSGLMSLANAVKAVQTSLERLFLCFLDETTPN